MVQVTHVTVPNTFMTTLQMSYAQHAITLAQHARTLRTVQAVTQQIGDYMIHSISNVNVKDSSMTMDPTNYVRHVVTHAKHVQTPQHVPLVLRVSNTIMRQVLTTPSAVNATIHVQHAKLTLFASHVERPSSVNTHM
jgi:hypothetical protein